MTSEQCGTQNNVQHCRLACSVTRTAVVSGKRRFCFPHRKGFHTLRFGCSGFVFAVIGFCHRLTHGQKCYDTYTNAYWSLFSFSMRIILYEQVSFSLAQAKLLSGFLVQQAQSVFLDLTFCFLQKRFKRNERNPPAGKSSPSQRPCNGLV